MTTKRWEFLVEEPSMEAVLRALLPKLLGTAQFAIHGHGGKRRLLARLPDRLRAYGRFCEWDTSIVILVDQDKDDCRKLKQAIEQVVRGAGLATLSDPPSDGPAVAIRILVEELESWFFGDWPAVRMAYPRLPAAIIRRARFRAPDAIRDPWEALEAIMIARGYFRGGLRKLEAAGMIGAHMDPERNTSPSFQAFREAIMRLSGR